MISYFDEKKPVLIILAAAGLALSMGAMVGGYVEDTRVLWVGRLGIALLLLAFGAVLMSRAWLQLYAVVFGALLVLGSAEMGLTIEKLGYAVLLLVFGVLAMVRVLGTTSTRPTAIALRQTALVMSMVYGGYLLATAANSIVHDIAITAWIRDTPTAFILLLVPLLAVSLRGNVTRRQLESLIIGGGLLSAVGTLSVWAAHRGVAEIPLPTSIFPTPWPALLLVCYAVSKVMAGSATIIWLSMMVVPTTLLLATGTRGLLLVFTGLILGVMFALVTSSQHRKSLPRFGMLMAVAGTSALGVLLWLSSRGTLDLARLSARFMTVTNLDRLQARDLSFEERINQTAAAWALFQSNPLFGAGVGHSWTYSFFSHTYGWVESKSMDSPVAFLAEQGVMGVIVITFFFAALSRLIKLDSAEGSSLAARVFVGAAIGCVVISVPLLDIFSDRGFALFTMLVTIVSLNGTMFSGRQQLQ